MKAVFGLAILLGTFIAISYVAGDSSEEKMKFVKECKDHEKATDEDVQSWIKDYTPPTTPTGKCLMACLLEKAGPVST